ncbi:hypothetical protein, partial [Crocosphaera sp.]|uniref:hypothetical protein n=1 Tax=Crocosphaera sp. TaxID=2729996 RepID=UPI003F256760
MSFFAEIVAQHSGRRFLLITGDDQVPINPSNCNSVSLIKHLYSQGEISIKQYNLAMNSSKIRNQVIHRFQTVEFNKEILSQLTQMVDQLIDLW